MLSAARALRALCLGIWLGGIVMAFIVAKIVFAEKWGLSRAQSGAIVFDILQVAGTVKTALAIALLASDAYLFFGHSPTTGGGWRRYLPAGLLIAAVAVMLIASLWLQPAIIALRDKIGDFSPATAGTPDRIRFGHLHGASMGLLLLEAILVAAAMITGLL